MSRNQFLLWNVPFIPMSAEEEKEEESMRRIFHVVPRRKRSQRGRKKVFPSPDISKLPRKKRGVYTHRSPPNWILRFVKDMKIVDDPVLITEKPLHLNDVDPSQNRLSVPFQILERNDFLTCHEWKILGDESINNDGKMGVAAFLVDQRTKQWQVTLKIWVRTTDPRTVRRSYLLSGEWSDVVQANGLRDGDHISLWAFRRHGILFFALDFAGDSIDFLE